VRDLGLRTSIAIDRKNVDLVRSVGHEQRPAVGAERDLSRIAAGAARRTFDGSETIALQHEARDVRLSAGVEHIDVIAVHGNAPRRRAARLHAIEQVEFLAPC